MEIDAFSSNSYLLELFMREYLAADLFLNIEWIRNLPFVSRLSACQKVLKSYVELRNEEISGSCHQTIGIAF